MSVERSRRGVTVNFQPTMVPVGAGTGSTGSSGLGAKALADQVSELASMTASLLSGSALLLRALRVLGEVDTDEGRALALARATVLAASCCRQLGQTATQALADSLDALAAFDPELPLLVRRNQPALVALVRATDDLSRTGRQKTWLMELHDAFVALGLVHGQLDATRMLIVRQRARTIDKLDWRIRGLHRLLEEGSL